MLIQARDAADARDLARKLTAAAGPGGAAAVRTVSSGARLAFDVPDELGAAVGRAPDGAADEDPPPRPARRRKAR